MPIILFLILVLVRPVPFSNSPLTLTLASDDSSKPLPQKHLCSCEIVIFPVSNDQYTLSIKSEDLRHDWVRVKIRSSGSCLGGEIAGGREASFAINSTKYQESELTEIFWVQVGADQAKVEEGCEGVEERGEERTVYLVNKTREQTEGEYQYIVNLPQNAIAVTQAASFLLLCLLSHNIRYRRFTPLQFNFPFVLAYALFLFATIYIDSILESALVVTFWLTMAFAMVCSLIYFMDLCSMCLNRTPLILAASLLLSFSLGVLATLVLPDAWPLNNLLGVLVAGTLIKFVVIKKLKSAVLPLLFLWVFFIFRQFLVFFHLESFEQVMHIKIVPLFLQLPAMLGDDEEGFICSAFGTSKIITMGLLLNFSVRVDLFLSSRFYTLVTTGLAFLCLLVEHLTIVLVGQLPALEYTAVLLFLPLFLPLTLLLASKRGEWAQLWHGSFHDIAVDRKSIRRESASLLDEDELERHLSTLKMNPSLLSSQQ